MPNNERRRPGAGQDQDGDASTGVIRGDHYEESTSSLRHLASAALKLAANGWEVFPLRPGTKEPFKGSRGFKDATTEADQLNDWWSQCPDANIAVAVPRGFVVIDADIYKPGGREDLMRLERELGQLPASPTVRTARGGLQFWFRCPPNVKLKAKAADTIDIRAGGTSYVVAPPSVFEGGRYEWIA